MEEQEGDLSWLQDFIHARFYEKCQLHQKVITNFCCECSGLPFCEKCKYSTHQHDSHNVLRVSKSSHHAGINVLMIKKMLDVSDIQTYTINRKKIVYISHRQRIGKISNEKAQASGRKCEVCGWSNLSSLFCSIECKVNWASKEEESIEQESRSSHKPVEEHDLAPSRSYMIRRRKGYPERAPLM